MVFGRWCGLDAAAKWSGLEHSFTYTIRTTSPFAGMERKDALHLSLDAASALCGSH